MPTFFPPTVNDVPNILRPMPPYGQGLIEDRLFGHFSLLPRGRTILLLKPPGTCIALDWPSQLVPTDPSEGDPFTESGIGGYLYTAIDRVFMGGHIYSITDEEATRLTACGYGANITGATGFGDGGFGEGGFGG